jgi:hypothetical protein
MDFPWPGVSGFIPLYSIESFSLSHYEEIACAVREGEVWRMLSLRQPGQYLSTRTMFDLQIKNEVCE